MIQIPNWDAFQHYRNRRPPWIKLYRDLLDKREWRELSGDASKLLADCWLLAAESKVPGFIDMSAVDLSWRLRIDRLQTVRLLQELVKAGFIEWDEADASKMLAVS